MAIVIAVVAVALRSSEERQIYRLAREARPWWTLVALALQGATYLVQGEIWRVVTRAGGVALAAGTSTWLSIGKLFVDQALPSAGISGNILIVKGLEDRGVPRPVVAAAIVVDTASCYATYVLGLAAALVITSLHHETSLIVLSAAIPFTVVSVAVTAAVLVLSGRRSGVLADKLGRIAPVQRALRLFEAADDRLARNPRVLATASLCQLAIILLDAATMWALVAALGAHVAPSGVFASFMISTLFRLLGLLPGGLGTFEAASVLTLKVVGVPVPVGLAATLLFRGLSFWLPMAPGVWLARRAARS